jgi:hypothetical protein
MRHFLIAIFMVFFLISCNKKTENNDISKTSIEHNDNITEVGKNEAQEIFLFLDDEEIKKIINENIFYGINTDPNYYMNNNKYTVEYDFDEEDPEMGIAQDTNFIFAYNNYITISFANNMLTKVYITKKTDIHFLGKYIGENINLLDEIFGNVYKWQQGRAQFYSIKNNDIPHVVQVIKENKDSEIIHSIDIGVSGILSSGKLPKIVSRGP